MFRDVLQRWELLLLTVCLYWRGSWDLIGYYVLPDKVPLNYFVQAAIGCCTYFNYLILPYLDKHLPKHRKVLYFVVTRSLLAWHGIQYMFLWRGCWMLADHFITRYWGWALLSLVLDLFIMSLLRVARSTMWPPFMVSLDTSPTLLVADNRFHVPPSKPFLYALDSFFSAIVVTGMAIFSWRCVWCVWDGLLLPDDSLMSDVVNFAAGCLGTTFLLSSQRALAAVSISLEKQGKLRTKYAWEGVLYIFIFVVLSSLWRGGWNLNVRYLISDPWLGGWVNHLCGAVLFLLLQTYSLVGGWGVGEDGADPDGQAFFPIHYLRICFRGKIHQPKDEKIVTEEDKSAAVPLHHSAGETTDGYIVAPDYFVSRSISRTGFPYDPNIAPPRMPDDDLNEETYRMKLYSSKTITGPQPKYGFMHFEDPWETRPSKKAVSDGQIKEKRKKTKVFLL